MAIGASPSAASLAASRAASAHVGARAERPATARGADTLRVANCSGFFGDRLSAAKEMVDGGPIDVLTGDWLAELTMLILARTRLRRPGGGYARTFVTQMEQVLGTCIERGIKVVSNAGGLDPDGCAAAVAEVAAALGVSPRIAVLSGDDLAPRWAGLVASGAARSFDGGSLDPARSLTANAYLGGHGVAAALAAGADVVICGRITDAALVSGPATWFHGWGAEDLDQLAGAMVAGHVIECGTQATGGNYSFFADVPGLLGSGSPRLGFPFADIEADGSSTIGMHDGESGLVSVGTVTSQLLYEIGGPRYLGPDVTARFDSILLEQTAQNRVRISGVVGEEPPLELKVATNEMGGYKTSFTVALTGLDIETKAEVVHRTFWDACPLSPDDFEACVEQVIRSDHEDAATNAEATALWRLALRDPDEAKLGRTVSSALIETALGSIPGMYSPGAGPAAPSPYGVYRPALVDRAAVAVRVALDGEQLDVFDPWTVRSAAPQVVPIGPPASGSVWRSGGPTVRAPLGTVIGARSGDKGGDANLGLFVRRSDEYAWLAATVTVERIRLWLPEVADLEVERFEFPNVLALNLVIHGLLWEGVAASPRQDAQAKSLGEWLRSRFADIPAEFIDRY